MIRLGMSVENNIVVACSGGVDSMAALSFLNTGKRSLTVAYMNHGTIHSDKAESFVSEYCIKNSLTLQLGKVSRQKYANESSEEYWRNMRYEFLHGFDCPVVLAHHLDDCVEQWIFSSAHGKPGIIPVSNKNAIRPFMLNKKSALVEWCKEKNIPWIEDESNTNTAYSRNRIRHNIIPEIMKINPGIHKTVCRIVQRQYNELKK